MSFRTRKFGKHSSMPAFFKLCESPHCSRCDQRQGRATTLGPHSTYLEPRVGGRVAEHSEFKATLHYKFKPRELHEALFHKKQNKTSN